MKANDILKQVISTLESRGKENGYDQKEERSADSIAEIFNAISDKELNAADVWKHMVALKLARLKSQIMNGSDVTDSIVDLIGYTALLGEELTKVTDVATGDNNPDAVAEDDEGWISWGGGTCPVKDGTLVDVEYRDGAREFSLRANKTDGGTSRDAGSAFWMNDGSDGDIVKYRLAKDLADEENTDDGWIEWAGGDCPVGDNVLVDVEYRDGERSYALPASKSISIGGPLYERSACKEYWEHDGVDLDIVKYRLA